MKDKIIFFVFIMLALALVFSCSKSPTGSGDFPDNPLEWYSFEYLMEFYNVDFKYIGISIMTHDSISTGELTINGHSATLVPEFLSLYWFYVPYFDSTFIPLGPGDSISYTLSIDGKTFEGDLQMVFRPEVTWPDSLDPDYDFSFSWTIEEDPDIYLCTCDVEYQNEEYDESYYWDFSSPRYEYTIKRKYFDSDYLLYFDATLSSFNYKNFGSCFVCSDNSNNYYDDFFKIPQKSYTNGGEIGKEKRIERLKALLRVLN